MGLFPLLGWGSGQCGPLWRPQHCPAQVRPTVGTLGMWGPSLRSRKGKRRLGPWVHGDEEATELHAFSLAGKLQPWDWRRAQSVPCNLCNDLFKSRLVWPAPPRLPRLQARQALWFVVQHKSGFWAWRPRAGCRAPPTPLPADPAKNEGTVFSATM